MSKEPRPALDEESLKAGIRERYGRAARGASSCGEGTPCCGGDGDPVTRDLYRPGDTEGIPAEAVVASLGCGNPTALAELRPGEVVLDLGSGGGLDVLMTARRVGSSGKVYGLDMTDEMLALARANQRKAGVENVEFLRGDIERIPLPDASVDVIISNCVINLAADKDKVLREAFRVLRPGGRFAVSDIVALGPVPEPVRRSMELWMGCVAGALDAEDFRRRLVRAGFRGAGVEVTRVYRAADAEALLAGLGPEGREVAAAADGAFGAAFIRGTKPAADRCVTLRDARASDRARVEALLAAAGLPLDGLPDDLARFTVAEDPSGAVIGAAGLEVYGPSGLLRSAVVDAAWRNRGVGRALVEDVLSRGNALGLHDIFLLTTTAEGWFPEFGFTCITRAQVPEPVAASAEFRGACPASATVMRRTVAAVGTDH